MFFAIRVNLKKVTSNPSNRGNRCFYHVDSYSGYSGYS